MFRSPVPRSQYYCATEFAEVSVAEYLEIPIRRHSEKCKNHENDGINIAITGISNKMGCVLNIFEQYIKKTIKIEKLYEYLRQKCNLMSIFANELRYVNEVDMVLYHLGIELDAQLKNLSKIRKEINGYKTNGYKLSPSQSKKFLLIAKRITTEYEKLHHSLRFKYPTFTLSIVRSYHEMGDVPEEIEELPHYCKELVIIGESVRDWLNKQNKRTNPQNDDQESRKLRNRRTMLEKGSNSVVPEIRERSRFLLQETPLPKQSLTRAKQSMLDRTSRSKYTSLIVPYDIMQRVNQSNYDLSLDELIKVWYDLSKKIGECFDEKIVSALKRIVPKERSSR